MAIIVQTLGGQINYWGPLWVHYRVDREYAACRFTHSVIASLIYVDSAPLAVARRLNATAIDVCNEGKCQSDDPFHRTKGDTPSPCTSGTCSRLYAALSNPLEFEIGHSLFGIRQNRLWRRLFAKHLLIEIAKGVGPISLGKVLISMIGAAFYELREVHWIPFHSTRHDSFLLHS